MNQSRHSEDAFETVIKAHILGNGYVPLAGDSFDRGCAIFPKTVLAFIRETQPKERARPEVLHSAKIRDQVPGDLCTWMDTHGAGTIALIKERRASLIAAAVTGQIDVGSEA